jgi:hypothetical protein
VRKLFTTRRRIAVVSATAVAVLGVAGVAFAYFTTTGSGTGQAAVGSAASWSVTAGPPSGTLYPGLGPATINFTVKNTGSGNQAVTAANATLGTDGSGNITQNNGSPVPGCLTTWFTVPSVTTTLPTASVAPGSTTTIAVSLQLNDAAVSQNACEGTNPDVTLHITG